MCQIEVGLRLGDDQEDVEHVLIPTHIAQAGQPARHVDELPAGVIRIREAEAVAFSIQLGGWAATGDTRPMAMSNNANTTDKAATLAYFIWILHEIDSLV